MKRHSYDLVCIGTGPAGQRAAIQAAKLGKRVAVVERGMVVGGACLENGTIPSKTFREAVRLSVLTRQLDRGMGHLPRIRPTTASLLARVDEVRDREAEVVRDQLERNDVHVFTGEASFVHPHRIQVRSPDGERTLHAEFVLVAVGTVPSRPDGVACDAAPVIVSDGVLALEALPRTMVVVGSGVIGVEYASMFAALGTRVTIVDARDRILEFLDREVGDELVHQLRNQNVRFRLGEEVAGAEVVEERGRRCGVLRLASGKCIVSDVVLFSVGRVGATAGLGLEAIGIQTDKRGRVKVDASFRTDLPHVYAAGDVVGFPSLAATSAEQGRRAALHMFGVSDAPMGAHFPIGIYAIPEIAMVGGTEEALTAERVPYEVGIARYRDTARGQIVGDTEGFLKLIFHRESRALLGVHVLGTGATELVHTGQAVMALGGGLDYFLETVFNYPTLAEAYKVAAMDAYNKLELARRFVARVA
jgi:NAD(P) transhydrogenase